MLQGAVLPFSLLTDDDQVQVVMASAVALQAVDMDHVSKEVQFTPVEWTRWLELIKKKIEQTN